MPIKSRINPEQKLVIVRHVGSVPDGEFLTSYKALFQDARYDKSFNILIDLRRADSSARSPNTLRDFASFVQQQFAAAESGPKVAVVAPDDISFGMARMYEALSDSVPWEFKVFRDAAAAVSWLGLPEKIVGDLD